MFRQEDKWQELLKWRWAFAWIPFVDFALLAGSMAMGEAHEDSDFDIILGCKRGRMFIARAFTICIFNCLGKRRKGRHTKKESKNKFCFNHFVTPDSYTLRPPYNKYWRTLYQNLVPIYGEEEKINKFFLANTWANSGAGSPTSLGKSDFERRFKKKQFNLFRTPVELLLGNFLGIPFEYILMRYQLHRIQKRSDLLREIGSRADRRLYADENELELHPDTSRIEDWLTRAE